MSPKILVIHDEPEYRALLSHHITTRWSEAVVKAYDPLTAGQLPADFAGAGHDLVLLGDPAGGGDALLWLRRFARQPRFPPVIIVGADEEQRIVAAIKAGAEDYLVQSRLTHERIVSAVELALRLREPQRPPAASWSADALSPIVGSGAPGIRGYELVRRLARGALSAVYLVRDKTTDREVVLKIFHPQAEQSNDEMLDRFLREYQLVAQVEHPNVVRIHDLGVADEQMYIVMEYCSGGSLRQRLGRGLAKREILRILRDCAGALGALHSAGILHRDLKPSNVLFRADGSLALIDFGLATQVSLVAELTGVGAIFGTPYYMSPEQGHGSPVDHRGDIYSLGVILFEMLTGQKPFEGQTAMAVIIQHRQAPIPELPKALAEFQPLLSRMLAKNPEDRPQSAEEVLELAAAIDVAGRAAV